MKKAHFILLIITVLIMTGGCSKNDNEQGAASLQFYLTDSPGEYQQVNIDLEEIKIIFNDSIIDIPTIPGIYNLLEFTNGKDTLIADAELTEGKLSQIRLILGENNSLMIDSVIYDLKTPSAQTSGLKLNVHQEIIPGEAYSYVIDFDAKRSIVSKGNGGFNLKPVIRVFTEVLTGSIHGVISPASSDSLINLILAEDTITTNSDTLGHYMFRGLEPGIYSMDILAKGNLSDTTLADIEVFAGETTEIDTIFLD
jgi:hypothetical protein